MDGDKKKKLRGLGGVFRHPSSPFWYIFYTPPDGKQRQESSKSTNRADAVRLLNQRRGELSLGRPAGAQFERTTLREIAELVLNDYRQSQKRSLKRVEEAFRLHLFPFFNDGNARVQRDITFGRIERYKTVRLEEPPRTRGGATTQNATVNYELRILKRALHMGVDAGLVTLPLPKIVLLQENNVRKGFVRREQFEAICRYLPAHLVPLVRAHYITGWRVRSELQTRKWEHVDLSSKDGVLRLEPGESKNRQPRNFPIAGELRQVLVEQAKRKMRLGLNTPWVFFYDDGSQIKHYRRAWRTAVRAAGLEGIIPHDLRRSAVFNLARTGTERQAAMLLVGHKTESMYRRYFPEDPAMLRNAVEKLDQLRSSEFYLSSIEPAVDCENSTHHKTA